MTPRRILLVTSSLGLGGAEKHIAQLCRHYISKGAVCSVLYRSPGKDDLVGEIREAGAGSIPFDISSLSQLLNPFRLSALRRAAREFAPDLVHAHLYHGEVIGALCARFTGVPLIATRHSSGLEFNGLRKCLIGSLRETYSGIIAVSDEAAAEARQQGFEPLSISVIPNAVDARLFRPLPPDEKRRLRKRWEESLFGDSSDRVLIGTMGGLRPVKDHLSLLEAMRKVLSDEGPDPRLVIIGEGPERTPLARWIEEAGLSGSIALPGTVAEPWTVLPLLDVFVLSSRSEGIPIALLEAMACSTACISTEVGGTGDILGGAGILVEAGDIDGMAGGLSRLAARPEERDRIASACRDRVVSRYGIERWGEATWKVLEKVSASRSG